MGAFLRVVSFVVCLTTAGIPRSQQPLVPSNARWSPDGASVVFYAEVDGQTDVFVQSLSDGRLHRLTAGPASDYGPDFSPDGEWIAFYSGAGSEYRINLMRRDGSERREVSCGGTYEGNPHFSPDGSRIAFSSNRDGNHEIYLMARDGSGCTRVTDHPGNDWTPRFSPDGRRLVFASDRGGDFSIYTVALDGSDVRLVADAHPHDYYPDWSPDGTSIAFFAGPDYDHFEIYVVDLARDHLAQVTFPPLTASNPAWSPGGDLLMIGATVDSEDTLMAIEADGSHARRLRPPGT